MPLTAFSISSAGRVLACVALAVLIAGNCWLYGGALTVHQLWGVFVAAILVLATAAVVLATAEHPRLPWLAAILAMAIALGAFQLVPLSARWQSVFCPKAVSLRDQLQSDVRDELRSERAPVSLYPGSTRKDLSLLIVPCVVFAASVVHLRSLACQRALCWFLAVHGALVALFGIAQQLTFNGKLFWTVELSQGGSPFASFVNRNHAAAHLNLCLAGMLPLLIWQFRSQVNSQVHRSSNPQTDRFAIQDRWRSRLGDLLADRIAALTGTTLLLAGMAILLIAAILCTSSRGGIAALAFASASTGAIMALRRLRASMWTFVAASIVAVAMTYWLGQGEIVARRLEGLGTDLRQAADSRWNHWRQSARAIPDFLMAGSGLGTYRYIYPSYQVEAHPAWYYHAENQYLEALIELGAPGLALLLGAIVLALYRAGQNLRSGELDWQGAMGIGGIFAITAAAMQAGVDFHLYMPANALLLAVLVAAQAAMSISPAAGRPAAIAGSAGLDRVLPAGRRRRMWLTTLLIAGVAIIWAGRQLTAAANRESVRHRWDRALANRPTDPAAVDPYLNALAPIAGGDADACSTVAAMHVWRFRISAWQRMQEELGSQANAELLWDATDPVVLHRQLHLAGNEASSLLPRFDDLIDDLRQAGLWYEQSLRACPLRAANHLALARLSPVVIPRDMERRYLDRAVQVAPADADVLFQAGRLAHDAGWTSLAFQFWNRSLRQADRHLTAILQLMKASERVDRPADYQHVFAGIPQRALEAAQASRRIASLADQAMLLATVADSLMRTTPLAESQREYLLSGIARLREQPDQAIRHLERAVTAQPDQLAWRAELADLLLLAQRPEEAYRHARICRERAPQSRAYQQLLRKVMRKLQANP